MAGMTTGKVNAIVYQYTAKDGSIITYSAANKNAVKFNEDKNGLIHINGNNAIINLPENYASKLSVENSQGLQIIDGVEKNGKSYSDTITFQNSSKCFYDVASKERNGQKYWATDPTGGDNISIYGGKDNSISLRSGNNLTVNTNATNTKVETYQGSTIVNDGFNTSVDVKTSPNSKYNPSDGAFFSSVTLAGRSSMRVSLDPNTSIVDQNHLMDSNGYKKDYPIVFRDE